MELLTDTVTPSLQDYQTQLRNYSYGGSSSTRQRANDWAAMYYQNAYNIAMQNYMNEYNSPLQQMLRYTEAGLNPFLVQADAGNMGSLPSGAAPKGSQDHGVQDIQAAFQGINTINDTLQTSKDLYDYIKYGRPLAEYKNEAAYWDSVYAQNRAYREGSEADWAQYWNTGVSMYPSIESSPRARYMEASTEVKSNQIEQLKALTNLVYPSQKEANAARSALTVLQKQVLEGQKGAILQIDTGNKKLDSILQMVAYWILNR